MDLNLDVITEILDDHRTVNTSTAREMLDEIKTLRHGFEMFRAEVARVTAALDEAQRLLTEARAQRDEMTKAFERSELARDAESRARPALTEEEARDAARYRRLRVLGAAPATHACLERGTVLCFTNLDEFVDADRMLHPSRGEPAPAPSHQTCEPGPRVGDVLAVMRYGAGLGHPSHQTCEGAPRWRPEVVAFADAMEAKLKENDWKGGWKRDPAWALMRRVEGECAELRGEVVGVRHGNYNRVKVLREAADVANMAMMVADVCGALPAPSTPPAPRAVTAELGALCEHGRYISRCVDCGAEPINASVSTEVTP